MLFDRDGYSTQHIRFVILEFKKLKENHCVKNVCFLHVH